MSSAKSVNHSLNIIKGLACIFVVFMHVEFPGILGIVVQCISRWCVPMFFAVSGYFCFYEGNPGTLMDRMPGKLLHITKITLTWVLIYILWRLAKECISGGINEIVDLFSNNNIIKWIVFNQPFLSRGHLWFLYSLIYSYFTFWLFMRLERRWGMGLMIGLLVCHFGVAYGAHLIGVKIPNCLYRNFFLEGFPFMLMGYYCHKYEDILIRISNFALVWMLVIGVMFSLAERWLLGRDFGLHIGSVVVLVALMAIAVGNKDYDRLPRLELLGAKYSLWVYGMHMLVYDVLVKSYQTVRCLKNCRGGEFAMPVAVLIVTIGSGIIFYWFKDAVNNRKSA